jgi:hypothetical protein
MYVDSEEWIGIGDNEDNMIESLPVGIESFHSAEVVFNKLTLIDGSYVLITKDELGAWYIHVATSNIHIHQELYWNRMVRLNTPEPLYTSSYINKPSVKYIEWVRSYFKKDLDILDRYQKKYIKSIYDKYKKLCSVISHEPSIIDLWFFAKNIDIYMVHGNVAIHVDVYNLIDIYHGFDFAYDIYNKEKSPIWPKYIGGYKRKICQDKHIMYNNRNNCSVCDHYIRMFEYDPTNEDDICKYNIQDPIYIMTLQSDLDVH